MHKTTLFTLAVIALAVAADGRVGGTAPGQSPPQGIAALAPSPPDGPPPDPAAVARGAALYDTTLNCAACHGVTGRGGPGNAPDVTKSALAGAARFALARALWPRVDARPRALALAKQARADLTRASAPTTSGQPKATAEVDAWLANVSGPHR